jgi:hypothetical protein
MLRGWGLVEYLKQFGAKGNGLRLLSLVLGISMAVALCPFVPF